MAKLDLFHALEAGLECGFYSAEDIVGQAEAMDMEGITIELAESAVRVAAKWLDEQVNGNGEYSRMRHEAQEELKLYIHLQSGDVATAEMWKDDFENMGKDNWFGLPMEECENLHWLEDAHFLAEAVYNSDEDAWEDA